jgi:hypothetical protein
MVQILVAFAGCAQVPDEAPAPASASAARTAAEAGVLPDCDLAVECGLPVAAGRCVDDPTWFDVSQVEGEIVEATLRPGVDTSALAEGTWYAVFPGATSACAGLTVAFEVRP